MFSRGGVLTLLNDPSGCAGMYMAVAEIVERVSGLSFSQYAHKYLLEPLSLHSTTYNGTAAMLSGELAEGFVRVRQNVTEANGGTGPLKYEYRPTDFFINDDRHDLMGGPGGVSMSAKDVVHTNIWMLSVS